MVRDEYRRADRMQAPEERLGEERLHRRGGWQRHGGCRAAEREGVRHRGLRRSHGRHGWHAGPGGGAEVIEAENESIEQIKKAIYDNKDDISALIIEPIQGEGGDHHFRKEYFEQLRELCDENEILFVHYQRYDSEHYKRCCNLSIEITAVLWK